MKLTGLPRNFILELFHVNSTTCYSWAQTWTWLVFHVKRYFMLGSFMLVRFDCSSTVRPVYNNHSRDYVLVGSVDRWSLYRGTLVSLRWPMEQLQWSLYTGRLSMQVVCKT